MYRLLYQWWLLLKEACWITVDELRRIFTDPGVMVIFFLGSLAYPVLYKAMYWNEQVQNIPVAVVMSAKPDNI